MHTHRNGFSVHSTAVGGLFDGDDRADELVAALSAGDTDCFEGPRHGLNVPNDIFTMEPGIREAHGERVALGVNVLGGDHEWLVTSEIILGCDGVDSATGCCDRIASVHQQGD